MARSSMSSVLLILSWNRAPAGARTARGRKQWRMEREREREVPRGAGTTGRGKQQGIQALEGQVWGK